MKFRPFLLWLLFLMAIVATAGSPVWANSLVNPGFEDPITFDGPPFVGSWEGFSGAFAGGMAAAANGTVMPRSGLQTLDLLISNDNQAFAGAFQDVPNLVANQIGTFSGWHKLFSGNSGGTEIRIEWRNSATNTEVSRTPNLTPMTSADYTEFSLTAAVPMGADTARVVYAIQSFGGAGNQRVFVDDTSFVVVPEPAMSALLGLGLFVFRRKR